MIGPDEYNSVYARYFSEEAQKQAPSVHSQPKEKMKSEIDPRLGT